MAYRNKCAKLIYTPLSLRSVSFSSWQHPHERKCADFTQFWRNRLISYTPSFTLYYTWKSHALKNIMEAFSFSGLSGSFCLFGLLATPVGPTSDPRWKQRLHAGLRSKTLNGFLMLSTNPQENVKLTCELLHCLVFYSATACSIIRFLPLFFSPSFVWFVLQISFSCHCFKIQWLNSLREHQDRMISMPVVLASCLNDGTITDAWSKQSR